MADEPLPPWIAETPPDSAIPPLLARMLDRQAASGLAPPYLPKDDPQPAGIDPDNTDTTETTDGGETS